MAFLIFDFSASAFSFVFGATRGQGGQVEVGMGQGLGVLRFRCFTSLDRLFLSVCCHSFTRPCVLGAFDGLNESWVQEFMIRSTEILPKKLIGFKSGVLLQHQILKRQLSCQTFVRKLLIFCALFLLSDLKYILKIYFETKHELKCQNEFCETIFGVLFPWKHQCLCLHLPRN